MRDLKLTTYFGERSRIRGRLLADELLDMHARHEIRASILLRGIQGFGAKHHRRTDRLLTLSEDLPLVCIAVDAEPRIEALAQEIGAIEHSGLITVEGLRTPGVPTAERQAGDDGQRSAKLTVYLGRHERLDGQAAFAALCRLLRECEVAGATVMLGVDGTREGVRERARFFARNARVPLMTVAVGDAAPIERALAAVRRALPHAVLTVERVTICKRDGQLLQAPAHPSEGDRAPRSWRKLTLVTSEAARHERRPVYLELVKRLREARCAGATSLRGIWGYHGDHAPHGDRLVAIRRHVPVVTEAIDTSERIAALFPIVDELTRERGLVTCEELSRAPAGPRPTI